MEKYKPKENKKKKEPPTPFALFHPPEEEESGKLFISKAGRGLVWVLKNKSVPNNEKKITSDLGERRISEFQKRGKMAAKESDKMARSSHHRNKPEIEKFTRNQCHSNFPVFTNGNIFLVCLEKRVRRSDMIVMVMREPPHLHILGIAGEV